MQSSSRRKSSWFVWIGGVIALFIMLILSVVLRVTENESKAWPIFHAVVARLATDEGARDLYAKNPALANSYDTAEDFLKAVQAQRTAFGTLPRQEPTSRRDGFRVDANPQGLRAYAKGSGGSWMVMELEKSDGTQAGHDAIGEGIIYLGFGASESSMNDMRQEARSARNEVQWKQFLEVEQALLTESGTQELLQANPDLATDEAARAAFLEQARTWRPRLLASTPPATWAKGVDAPDDMVSLNRRHMAPFGERAETGWKPKEGSWLRVTWSNGHLVKITLGD